MFALSPQSTNLELHRVSVQHCLGGGDADGKTSRHSLAYDQCTQNTPSLVQSVLLRGCVLMWYDMEASRGRANLLMRMYKYHGLLPISRNKADSIFNDQTSKTIIHHLFQNFIQIPLKQTCLLPPHPRSPPSSSPSLCSSPTLPLPQQSSRKTYHPQS